MLFSFERYKYPTENSHPPPLQSREGLDFDQAWIQTIKTSIKEKGFQDTKNEIKQTPQTQRYFQMRGMNCLRESGIDVREWVRLRPHSGQEGKCSERMFSAHVYCMFIAYFQIILIYINDIAYFFASFQIIFIYIYYIA